jgi:ribosomal protein S27E
VALDQASVDKIKAAPGKCPSCGGTITTVVLRGMDSITCEFCGAVIRL